MRLAAWAAVLILVAIGSARPAAAQVSCDHLPTNEWLKQPPPSSPEVSIDDPIVVPVREKVSKAVTLLEERTVIEISRADVIQLVGESAKEAVDSAPSDLEPYLVRAVFPVARPTLSISWSGEALHVFAAGLGCAPYTKQPIIVFLDRQPEDVFVMAMSAL